MESFVIIKSNDKRVTIIRQGCKEDSYWVKIIRCSDNIDVYRECISRGVDLDIKQDNGFVKFTIEKQEYRQFIICGIKNRKGYNLTALVNSIYE